MPQAWAKLLQNSGISAAEKKKNPQGVIKALEFYTATSSGIGGEETKFMTAQRYGEQSIFSVPCFCFQTPVVVVAIVCCRICAWTSEQKCTTVVLFEYTCWAAGLVSHTTICPVLALTSFFCLCIAGWLSGSLVSGKVWQVLGFRRLLGSY